MQSILSRINTERAKTQTSKIMALNPVSCGWRPGGIMELYARTIKMDEASWSQGLRHGGGGRWTPGWRLTAAPLASGGAAPTATRWASIAFWKRFTGCPSLRGGEGAGWKIIGWKGMATPNGSRTAPA